MLVHILWGVDGWGGGVFVVGHEVSVIKGFIWQAYLQNKWTFAISRQDLTDTILELGRICGKHFISGQAAKLWDRYNPDWVPTQNLGHEKCDSSKNLQTDLEAAAKQDQEIIS